jgi:hypothetical protein
MAYVEIASSAVDADSPVDQVLMTQINDNLKFLKTRSEGQTVNSQDGSYSNLGSTAFTDDDTIPQNTEGNEALTLSITPNSATSTLYIDIIVNTYMAGSGVATTAAALFQDSAADALASIQGNSQLGLMHTTTFRHKMTSGTTSATTFKVRVGRLTTGTTIYMNGDGVARRFGGTLASSITITEIP